MINKLPLHAEDLDYSLNPTNKNLVILTVQSPLPPWTKWINEAQYLSLIVDLPRSVSQTYIFTVYRVAAMLERSEIKGNTRKRNKLICFEKFVSIVPNKFLITETLNWSR